MFWENSLGLCPKCPSEVSLAGIRVGSCIRVINSEQGHPEMWLGFYICLLSLTTSNLLQNTHTHTHTHIHTISKKKKKRFSCYAVWVLWQVPSSGLDCSPEITAVLEFISKKLLMAFLKISETTCRTITEVAYQKAKGQVPPTPIEEESEGKGFI